QTPPTSYPWGSEPAAQIFSSDWLRPRTPMRCGLPRDVYNLARRGSLRKSSPLQSDQGSHSSALQHELSNRISLRSRAGLRLRHAYNHAAYARVGRICDDSIGGGYSRQNFDRLSEIPSYLHPLQLNRVIGADNSDLQTVTTENQSIRRQHQLRGRLRIGQSDLPVIARE